MSSKISKEQQLKNLYAPYKQCMACPLATQGRSQVVFGSGSADAEIMLIGEGPGQNEDLQGLPFVGRSGALLNKIFELLEVDRNDFFISNIVKCRPPNNRKPLPQESNTCKNILLHKQIKIVAPKVICTLGGSAAQGLLEQDLKITKIRGTEFSYQGIPLIPTYHPAYILRNPSELECLVNDLRKAISYLSK